MDLAYFQNQFTICSIQNLHSALFPFPAVAPKSFEHNTALLDYGLPQIDPASDFIPFRKSNPTNGVDRARDDSPAPPLCVLRGVRAAYFPVRPSQMRIDLSNEADAMSRESGEKRTSLMSAW